MTTLPSGTVTFLFTDIEGSTALLQRLGDRYAEALHAQRQLLRAAWAAHDGHEVDTQGDSFFVAFARASDAVAAAVQAQRSLASHAWPEGVAVRVRMGLHSGTPQLAGDHYVGLDVHRAARIAAAAHGGQVLLSDSARVLAEHDLPEGATLRDLGAHRLKDLQRPERLAQLVLPGLDADFPTLRTLDRHAHNLPIQPTPLLGREREVADLCALLQHASVRLVTLTGPGGVGKTRLGLQVAAELADALADGVWFVRLSRLTDPALVVPTIAQTLGLREAGSEPIEAILRDYLQTRSVLLLLDNFEQVAAAAVFVAELLATSASLKVLVTSRAVLHLRGEKEVLVSPLALPAPTAGSATPHLPGLDQLAQSPAVALFLQRARDVLPDFQLTAATAPAVVAICVRLDGLPLALELAAARVKLLPPPALLQRLERRLPLLTGGARDLEERQRTVRNTLAWSEEMLSAEERRLFRRLAVFVGGFTMEAAEAVCAGPEGVEPLGADLLDGLAALVDQSLVQHWTENEDESPEDERDRHARFRLLYVIREYALERLEASEGGKEAEVLRRAHAAYFVELADREWATFNAAALGRQDADDYLLHFDRLEPEQDNLRAALAWLRARAEVAGETGGTEHVGVRRATASGVEAPAIQGLRLAGALLWFWAYRGLLGEGREWVEAFLALDTSAEIAAPDPVERGQAASSAPRWKSTVATAGAAGEAFVRARALYAAAVLIYWQGDSAQPVLLLERSRAILETLGDRWLAGYVLNNLGLALKDQGDLARARASYEESLALGRALGAPGLVGMPLVNLATLALAAGDQEGAAAYSEEALTLARQDLGYTNAGNCLVVQALIAWRRGDLTQAAALAHEALEQHLAARDVRHYGDGLEVCAIGCAATGHFERAAHLLGAAAASRERIGMRRSMEVPAADDIEAAVLPVRASLGADRWTAAFEAGRALSIEEAAAEALGETD